MDQCKSITNTGKILKAYASPNEGQGDEDVFLRKSIFLRLQMSCLFFKNHVSKKDVKKCSIYCMFKVFLSITGNFSV